MNDLKNIEECNPNKECKILITSDDMISGMLSNKKFNPTITDLLEVHFCCCYHTILFCCSKKN